MANGGDVVAEWEEVDRESGLEPSRWVLIDADYKEVADQRRAQVIDTPFGFVAVVTAGCEGPFRYRQSAMEWAEDHHRDGAGS